jgi:hypothetical protein
MTNEQAKKMLKAKLECLKRDTSGTDFDCNNRNCDDCSLNYEQGNMGEQKEALDMAIKALEKERWIPVSERLPETDNKNSINNYNVLLWVKDKSHTEREPQIYLGKLSHIDEDDGSGNFWGVKTPPCDWTIWGWSYFNEPEVIAWMPLPEPYKAETDSKNH